MFLSSFTADPHPLNTEDTAYGIPHVSVTLCLLQTKHLLHLTSEDSAQHFLEAAQNRKASIVRQNCPPVLPICLFGSCSLSTWHPYVESTWDQGEWASWGSSRSSQLVVKGHLLWWWRGHTCISWILILCLFLYWSAAWVTNTIYVSIKHKPHVLFTDDHFHVRFSYYFSYE